VKAQPKGSAIESSRETHRSMMERRKRASAVRARPTHACFPPFKLPTHGPLNKKNLNLIRQCHVSFPTLPGAEPTRARARAGQDSARKPVLMVIGTPFGCLIQLGVLSMSMIAPGHRVPETLLNVFPAFRKKWKKPIRLCLFL